MGHHTSIPAYKPLYLQLKEHLLARLAAGEWAPGEPLPSESALASEYHVSQGTLRKALDELAGRNLVVRQQGKGTFVAKHDSARSLFQFFHLRAVDGRRQLPGARTISCRRGQATVLEAERLDIDRRSPVYRIFRVRDLNGRSVLVEDISVSARVFPKLEVTSGGLPNTLYEFYENQYGVTIGRADECVHAVAAGPRDAKYLDVNEGQPLLAIDRRAFDLEQRPVEWRRSRCDTRHHSYFNALN